jgi:hypothetical protein
MFRLFTLLCVALALTSLPGDFARGQEPPPPTEQTAQAPQDPEQAERERAAILGQIVFLEMQIEKLEKDARDLDQLAAEALAQKMYVAAGNYRDLAAQYRDLIRQNRQEISELRRKLALLD